MRAVGRVDRDQDQAGLGGGELGQHPFGIVGRPDADPIAGLEPERQQAGGTGLDAGMQLGIAQAHALLAHDQRRMVPVAGDDAFLEHRVTEFVNGPRVHGLHLVDSAVDDR